MVVMMYVPSYRCNQVEHTLVSEPPPPLCFMLPQCNILVLRQAPKRGNPDQPNIKCNRFVQYQRLVSWWAGAGGSGSEAARAQAQTGCADGLTADYSAVLGTGGSEEGRQGSSGPGCTHISTIGSATIRDWVGHNILDIYEVPRVGASMDSSRGNPSWNRKQSRTHRPSDAQ